MKIKITLDNGCEVGIPKGWVIREAHDFRLIKKDSVVVSLAEEGWASKHDAIGLNGEGETFEEALYKAIKGVEEYAVR